MRASLGVTAAIFIATVFGAETRGADVGLPPGTMPPLAPACRPATCFEDPSLPGLFDPSSSTVVAATSQNSNAAIYASGGSSVGGSFSSKVDTGVEARTKGEGETALNAIVSATSGSTVAVAASVESPDGVGGELINEGSGDLLVLSASLDGPEMMRVANDGSITIKGQPILQKGPRGDQGPAGPTGDKGPRGDTGDPGRDGEGVEAQSFVVCAKRSSCVDVCIGGKLLGGVSQLDDGCYATADTGSCTYASKEGACCICGR